MPRYFPFNFVLIIFNVCNIISTQFSHTKFYIRHLLILFNINFIITHLKYLRIFEFHMILRLYNKKYKYSFFFSRKKKKKNLVQSLSQKSYYIFLLQEQMRSTKIAFVNMFFFPFQYILFNFLFYYYDAMYSRFLKY